MIKFGVQLCQDEFEFNGLRKAWREVEDMGFDSVWLYDHFYPFTATSESVLEGWTLLPALAFDTERLRLGLMVTCNSYRIPSVLAKMASTLDIMSGGRLEFGIGAGWHKQEYEAYGIPFPDHKTRIEQLDEAVELIKRIWTQDKADFQGRHYTIKDLVPYSKPVQKPHPPIWIGGGSNRILRLMAKHADYSNFGGSVEAFRVKLDKLEKYCLEGGRNYDDIQKTWFGRIIIGEREEVKRKALRFQETRTEGSMIREMSLEDFLNSIIAGTPEECVEQIKEYVDVGATYFIPHFPFAQDLHALRVFMDEVATSFS